MEKVTESRALPGGMLNSKEKTEYEDWLEKLHKKLDSTKADKDPCHEEMPLMDSQCGKNGYHNDDGTLIKDVKTNKSSKIFENIYKESGLMKFKEVASDTMFRMIDNRAKNDVMLAGDYGVDFGRKFIKIGGGTYENTLQCLADNVMGIPSETACHFTKDNPGFNTVLLETYYKEVLSNIDEKDENAAVKKECIYNFFTMFLSLLLKEKVPFIHSNIFRTA